MTTPITPESAPQSPRWRRSPLARKLLVGASAVALLAGASFLPQFAYSAPPPISDSIHSQASTLPNFADLVAKVKPAVFAVQVKIDPSKRVAENDGGQQPMPNPFQGGENPFKGTPFEHFFDGLPFQFRGGPNGNNQGPKELIQALGSGFFISADGYAVTNNHVVDGATKVEVVTDDGKHYKGKVIGTDPKTDLALIKVEGGGTFPYVKLAKKAPKIGEWVLAMGNPFGLGGTVTAGIVSAENRDIGSGPYDDFIQIDAAVNRGNSGGPTFNLDGEVVGVNTAIYSPSGGSVGIAFDIPSTTVNEIVPVLKEKGHIDRGWLGVQIQPVTDEIAQGLGLSESKGALVDKPEAGGPAADAGIKAGDVITKVNGDTVENARDLARKIGSMEPRSTADLTIIRNGKQEDVKLTLGAMKQNQKQTLASNENEDEGHQVGKLGLTVAPASSVQGAGSTGVAVTDVDPNGPAASSGIEPGDVILKIGDRDVGSPKELRQALSDAAAKGRSKALALVKHGNAQRYVALPSKEAAS